MLHLLQVKGIYRKFVHPLLDLQRIYILEEAVSVVKCIVLNNHSSHLPTFSFFSLPFLKYTSISSTEW